MNPGGEQTSGWAIKLPRAASAGVFGLRLNVGVEVGETEETIWLRGLAGDAALRRRLLMLPALGRYVWDGEEKLRPEGSRLATERMPELPWAPILAWAKIEAPVARLPASVAERAVLRLVPATETGGASNALWLEFAVWRDWALSAPVARLERLVFAASGESALVRGTPLPAAPGRHLVETDGVLIPAGLACAPAVSAGVLRRVWGVGEGDVVLWDEAGARVLGRELFVPATRANVRATVRAMAEEARA